nr:MAG TPA: hypothetical protein [Caudoviricetes sp.]
MRDTARPGAVCLQSRCLVLFYVIGNTNIL